MAQTLRDFINTREGEVRAQIKALNDELRELHAARSAIDGASASNAERAPSERMTHREMILEALDARPEGGTSDRVIEMVRERFGVEISQNSISSQLSRAKSDELVTLEAGTKVWRHARHSPKVIEPPEGGSMLEEGDSSSNVQSETSQGLPSAHSPDLAGQTRHWKMPGD